MRTELKLQISHARTTQLRASAVGYPSENDPRSLRIRTVFRSFDHNIW